MTAASIAPPVPADRIPDRPPELEGRPREDVRLVVSTPSGDVVGAFRDLPAFLRPGDLVVVNDSATLPASLPVGDGDERLHVSTPTPDGYRIVEVRVPTRYGSLPAIADHHGRRLLLPAGGIAELVAAEPHLRPDGTARLWRARLEVAGDLLSYLHRHGRPIRYGDPATDVPLAAYQTLFARRPGSSEMPSAARPFTPTVVASLRRRGVRFATITLHTGVSSAEAGEPPYPEPFEVPYRTADRVAATWRHGGRVIAVGTTVARALETVGVGDGHVVADRGWTRHVIRPGTPVRVVDGLLTGWHEPDASHLELLAAVAGDEVLARAYALADGLGIRQHEFGDSHLLLR